MNLDAFILFDPICSNPQEIPAGPGNYIVVFREGRGLPDSGLPVQLAKFHSVDVLYTGVAGASSGLRRRITRAHFDNNASRSTLRLSLGILLGFVPIPRDNVKPANGHTKFQPDEEVRLTEWMKGNLLVYFHTDKGYKAMENELISTLNPPLNLSKNANPVNSEIRALISELRTKVQISESLIQNHKTDSPIEVKRKPRKCPICGRKVVPIVYGYPSWDMQEGIILGDAVSISIDLITSAVNAASHFVRAHSPRIIPKTKNEEL